MNANSLPKTYVERQNINQIPQTHGVYYFVNHRHEIIYIGKSVNLRQRVKSHFSAAKRIEKERKLSLNTQLIYWHETAGELSALLLESHEIKRAQPFYNRRLRRRFKQYAWELERIEGVLKPRLTDASWPPNNANASIQFGAFKSMSHARNTLTRLIKSHQLCAKIMGLESSGRSCFAYQLKQCKGACVGDESLASHNRRVTDAMHDLSLSDWPFNGLVGLVESASPNEVNLFNSWYYLGTHLKSSLTELADQGADTLIEFANTQTAYELDRDSYRILLSFVTHQHESITLIDYSVG